MFKKLKICVFAVSLCMFSASYAIGSGTIDGKVIDGFGAPIEGVAVKIRKTKAEAVTDAGGNYEISYMPGITKLEFSKSGYTRVKTTTNLSETTKVDFKQVTLWKYPAEGGMYLLCKDSYRKVNYNTFLNKPIDGKLTYVIEGEPTVIPWSNTTFIDYESERPLVAGKDLYKVYDNNVLGSLGASKVPLHALEDKYVKIVNNVGLRIANLKPGKYFYHGGNMTNRTMKGYGYFFEIKP